ncbi:ATPase family associated with various cellular activities (AAA) domain-containing protein [Hirsutella rhossiliensis]|uniref:ATPase family associated with various cellular activities (AAA) domain-containing protein n=1 Tax=Hirsutella rhossiliensis TaxID=111463 RepID=A0A9P8N864_9HYPO|nr:ATPase family associated with various cellular activities (AAA) domain-containing protein [Hirsutella rhossiliensis]KAH0968317.1 ATPase family associated with various cellular activities (AAA) domain-containing protein [Hirsutella rhossiliensis]
MLAPAAARRASSPTVALAAGIPPRAAIAAARRAFHTPPGRRTAHGAGGGNKPPADDSVTEDDANAEPQAATETAGGRVRSQVAAASSRARQARKHVASALPPVNLPQSFLDNNVSIHTPGMPSPLPAALAEDAKHPKVSRLFSDKGPGSLQKRRALADYFDTALDVLLRIDRKFARSFADSRSDETNVRWNSPRPIEKVVRYWDMILDSAWHYVDAIYPARRPEYIYTARPFWWWDIYKDYDRRTHTFRHKLPTLALYLSRQLYWARNLDYPSPHVFLDLPTDTIAGLTCAVGNELSASPPPTFDAKRSKRPINILSVSGHGGSAVSEALGAKIAHLHGADLIRLDAYDLSVLVGEYLGQDWAYTRGGLSMLGFRAAELNGKLPREPEATERLLDDEDGDGESAMGGVRVVSGTLEEELQKIKQGAFDCFTKWENLKVDKILDHIIRSAQLKSPSSQPRTLLIQVHDIVELSMTLEGAQLISRLRALVDAAWQHGAKIAVLGTSSCEQPSEEYQGATQDLAVSDLVITRHLEADRADKQTALSPRRPAFNLQKAEYFVENMCNVRRMLRAMDPESAPRFREPLGPRMWAWFDMEGQDASILRDSILPAPEIYHLASAFRTHERDGEDHGFMGFTERTSMGPLRQKPGQPYPGEKRPEEEAEQSNPPRDADQDKTDPRASAMKLNDYEKRVSAGQIDRENLRTTFADVHAPPETISALRLLTSLTLVRPDAFSYGVLAQDRIPGCLLYGPPGTGKTMLAKAVAKESGANMLEISGATIHDKWVGESEKLIRAVFTLAKRLSPCVVFIDEADALLASRSIAGSRGVHREHLNQFLREWDGVQETNAFIMVATNRPFDLDDAVLRRLPRKILVDLPLRGDRAAILRLLLRGETLDDSVTLDAYAERTPFYSGSDLKNMCVAAAMAAVEEENAAAARHEGPEPFRYPERRVLRADHFERALSQIPASISEDMASLRMIRKFDDEYGGGRRQGRKKTMGFGVVERDQPPGTGEARIRRDSNP